MTTANLSQEAHRLVDDLPDDATWEGLMRRIYVREPVETVLPTAEAAAWPNSQRSAANSASARIRVNSIILRHLSAGPRVSRGC